MDTANNLNYLPSTYKSFIPENSEALLSEYKKGCPYIPIFKLQFLLVWCLSSFVTVTLLSLSLLESTKRQL